MRLVTPAGQRHIHVLYFADLTGAGTGCIIFLLAMQRAGAVNLVLLVCALVLVPSLVYELKNRTGQFLLAACLALLLVLAVFDETISSHIRPEPGKAINLEYRNVDPADVEIELSEWNTISRIDVVASKIGFPCEKGIFIDGDAWTFMQVDPQLPATPYDAAHESVLINKSPYFFKQEPESVLVIGTGGGVDVYNALRAGAKRIDAVEINPTTFRIMLEEYREASNALMVQPGVHAWREEGRSKPTSTPCRWTSARSRTTAPSFSTMIDRRTC
ncbi:MAG: hypothetical protein GWP08_05625 [Nitrospiraceae bacterium]|nr:hypothetical protein [Nitrospiraceae bacterium]